MFHHISLIPSGIIFLSEQRWESPPLQRDATLDHATRHYRGGSKELFPPRDPALRAIVSFRNWTPPPPFPTFLATPSHSHSLQSTLPLPSTCKQCQRMQEIIKMKFSLLKMAKLFFLSCGLPSHVARRTPHRVCRKWLVFLQLSFFFCPFKTTTSRCILM